LFGRDQRKREYDDDDGHVIANMNVEGMPWYRKEFGKRNRTQSESSFSPSDSAAIIAGTLKAALLIAGAFILGFLVLIIILCLPVWL